MTQHRKYLRKTEHTGHPKYTTRNSLDWNTWNTENGLCRTLKTQCSAYQEEIPKELNPIKHINQSEWAKHMEYPEHT